MKENLNAYGVVYIEPTIDQEVQEYCKENELDKADFVNNVIDRYITKNKKLHDSMIKGYAEMSRINLEISNEFSTIEGEVYSL